MKPVRLDGSPAPRFTTPAVAIGNFDGVHLGHVALAAATVERARALGGQPLVLSFDPHPARVLRPDGAPATLYTLRQRAELLGELGIEGLVVLPFDAERGRQPPDAFVEEVLVGRLGAGTVVVGEQFRFGRGRAGDVDLLRRAGERYGFSVAAIPPVALDGAPVSSSRVRDLLGRGEVRLAARLLSRPFFLEGRVVPGDGRGRTIGVPTANIEVENETLPAPGVYAGLAGEGGSALGACALNVGVRPTFGGGALLVEAHVLDFDEDLYGRRLRIALIERLREERRFTSVEALVTQIRDDVGRTRAVLAGYTPTRG
jgi:riboflavin kinase/FMN adenylyltransferase